MNSVKTLVVDLHEWTLHLLFAQFDKPFVSTFSVSRELKSTATYVVEVIVVSSSVHI